MSGELGQYVHATAVVIRERGVLIRGASGAGKSRLAAGLLAEAKRRGCFGRLVGDDRVALVVRGDRLLARGHPVTAGLIERRGEGLMPVPYEAVCAIDRVVDLVAEPLDRLPAEAGGSVDLLGISLPHRIVPAGRAALDHARLFDLLSAPVISTRGLDGAGR